MIILARLSAAGRLLRRGDRERPLSGTGGRLGGGQVWRKLDPTTFRQIYDLYTYSSDTALAVEVAAIMAAKFAVQNEAGVLPSAHCIFRGCNCDDHRLPPAD